MCKKKPGDRCADETRHVAETTTQAYYEAFGEDAPPIDPETSARACFNAAGDESFTDARARSVKERDERTAADVETYKRELLKLRADHADYSSERFAELAGNWRREKLLAARHAQDEAAASERLAAAKQEMRDARALPPDVPDRLQQWDAAKARKDQARADFDRLQETHERERAALARDRAQIEQSHLNDSVGPPAPQVPFEERVQAEVAVQRDPAAMEARDAAAVADNRQQLRRLEIERHQFIGRTNPSAEDRNEHRRRETEARYRNIDAQQGRPYVEPAERRVRGTAGVIVAREKLAAAEPGSWAHSMATRDLESAERDLDAAARHEHELARDEQEAVKTVAHVSRLTAQEDDFAERMRRYVRDIG